MLPAEGHSRLVDSRAGIPAADATRALESFELVRDDILDWGFEFGVNGADDIWPLDVVIRAPVRFIARYVTAPCVGGHFRIYQDGLVIPTGR